MMLWKWTVIDIYQLYLFLVFVSFVFLALYFSFRPFRLVLSSFPLSCIFVRTPMQMYYNLIESLSMGL